MLLLCAYALALVASLAKAGDDAHRPIADAGPAMSSLVGVPVIVDGSRSRDPGGQLIAFRWSVVEAPHGSTATLDAIDPAPLFVPDLPGVYALQLVVSNEDGAASVPAVAALVVYGHAAPPNVTAGRDRVVRVGAPADLDARASYDVGAAPLAFRWSIVAVPEASRVGAADLHLGDTATPWFVPDVPGAYVLEVQAGNGVSASVARVTLAATTGNVPPVANAGDHRYVDRAGSVALNGAASFDPDRGPSPLAFAWSLVARPAASALTGGAIGDSHAAIANVAPDAPGAYVFRLVVDDGAARDAESVLLRYAPSPNSAAVAAPAESFTRGAGTAATPRALATPPASKAMRSPADFTVAVTPAELAVAVGTEAAFTIKLEARSSAAAVAQLSVSGLPRGVVATFATPMLALGDSTTLTLRADPGVRAARFPLLVSAAATLGGAAIERSASVALRVTSSELAATAQTICGGVELPRLASRIYVAPGGSDSASCGRTVATACARRASRAAAARAAACWCATAVTRRRRRSPCVTASASTGAATSAHRRTPSLRITAR
jgi:hypothetical protein